MSVVDNGQQSSGSGRNGKGHQVNGLLRWAPIGAAVLYLTFALLMGANRVGLHYDEAIVQHGAVHMLNSASEPTFAHHSGSWVRIAGRYWPLAIIPYAGAVKDYILLLPFAIFGPSAEVARSVNALLGAFGIFGIATLLRREISGRVAAAVGFILAIHPAYISQTLFDYGVVVVWMAILGFISVAIAYYKKRQSAFAASLIGLAMGVGVWNRVNFVWFLASALIALVIVLGKRLLIPPSHIGALICGGVIGVFPMLLFQILSRGSLVAFYRFGQQDVSLSSLLPFRVVRLSETLLCDGEQRWIWNGPSMPAWQPYLFSGLLILALSVCVALGRTSDEKDISWRRSTSITFVVFAAMMFLSKFNVADHHLVTLVPIAAVAVVLAIRALISRWRQVRVLAVAVAVVYAASALYWNVAAAKGLRATGGVDPWSDAIYSVSDYLTANCEGREIKILDWGLQNNLFVLSNARIKSSEVFWGATRERDGSGTPWSEVVSEGGVYLIGSWSRVPREAPEGFLAALTASGRTYNRIEFRQKGGAPYVELIEIPSPQKSQPNL
ncbi:MAG TPA: glycosyltransferase family 39 protein [Blastocatellia bacterium]|nr:glycosyltransferase family 39 protein [Blastocatellia bacterium]